MKNLYLFDIFTVNFNNSVTGPQTRILGHTTLLYTVHKMVCKIKHFNTLKKRSYLRLNHKTDTHNMSQL